MTAYVIPYIPRKQFLPFHLTDKRFSVMCAHRRSGKTVAGLAKCIQKAVECSKPMVRVGAVSPFLKQAKSNSWAYLKAMTRNLPDRQVNETELKISWFDREIRLYGADNPDSIRGGYFDHVLCDEWAFADPSVYPTVIRPMLADRNGSADFASTPNGKNHFFKMFNSSMAESGRYFSMMLKADESGLLPQTELDDIRNDPEITEEQYAREFLCSFEAAQAGSYFGQQMNDAAASARITSLQPDLSMPVVTAWDLGHKDKTVVWFIQWQPDRLLFFDYYQANRKTIKEYCDIVNAKPYRYAAHYAPSDLSQFHLGMYETRYKQAEDAGVKFTVMPPEKHHMDGINAMRSILPQCWFDVKRCDLGIEALRSYREDEELGKPEHDWSSDASTAAILAARAYKSIFRKSAPAVPPAPIIIDAKLPTFADFAKTDRPARRKRL